ncbi:hypothetical protein [Streptomyces sp. NPDC059278]|uniref:hypothetical protein n=1 Tax=Streptomyces sp. NPDC059278 TaxID=3346801 RepID=UPI00367B9362
MASITAGLTETYAIELSDRSGPLTAGEGDHVVVHGFAVALACLVALTERLDHGDAVDELDHRGADADDRGGRYDQGRRQNRQGVGDQVVHGLGVVGERP